MGDQSFHIFSLFGVVVKSDKVEVPLSNENTKHKARRQCLTDHPVCK